MNVKSVNGNGEMLHCAQR